jgi:hypothetical protein
MIDRANLPVPPPVPTPPQMYAPRQNYDSSIVCHSSGPSSEQESSGSSSEGNFSSRSGSAQSRHRFRTTQEQNPRNYVRRPATHRQPYVREATDGGTEKALVPSPDRPSRLPSYAADSDITEEIERHDHHVAFQDLDPFEAGQDRAIGYFAHEGSDWESNH